MSKLILLILGLLITNLMHLVSASPKLRETLITKLSKAIYIALYASLSTLGLILIIYGYMDRDYKHIFDNHIWHLHLNKLLMLFALILLSAQFFKSHIKAKLKQPAILAVLIWAAGHMLANGDLYSIILFAGFLVYAIVAIIIKSRNPIAEFQPKWLQDIIAVFVGFILYGILFLSHEHFTGMPLL